MDEVTHDVIHTLTNLCTDLEAVRVSLQSIIVTIDEECTELAKTKEERDGNTATSLSMGNN